MEGEIPICKLHGSLNWSLSNAELRLYQDLRPVFRKGNEAAIVPPLTEKEAPDWLKRVWHAAEEILSAADTWIVCGYSLPSYDVAINELLSTAAKSKLKYIYVLDPASNHLRDKYNQVAPNARIVCLSGLPDGTLELSQILKSRST